MLMKLIRVNIFLRKILTCIFFIISLVYVHSELLHAQENEVATQAQYEVKQRYVLNDLSELEKLKIWKEKIEEERTAKEEGVVERFKEAKEAKEAIISEGFGYSLFMIDVNEIPPGPIGQDYILSPGDKIILKTWGQLQLQYLLEVRDDYYIEIPEAGRVFVSGVSLKDLNDLILRQMSTVYSAFIDAENPGLSSVHVDISPVGIRNARFIVQGAVKNPGLYSLHPSLSNIVYAIAKAGGVNSNASLRNIKIIKADKKIDIDLYDLLIKGDLTLNQVMVNNNDVIFVPVKEKACTVKGEVKMPGHYELLGNEDTDIDDFFEMVGGLTQSANLERIKVLRTEVNTGKRFIDVNLFDLRKEGREFHLMNGDVITVFSTNDTLVKKNVVTLKGNGVLLETEYPYKEGMRIYDLIKKAGSLKKDAYMGLASLIRINKDNFATKEALTFNLGSVIDGDEKENYELQSGDVLIIRENPKSKSINTIEIKGEVVFPGIYSLVPEQNTLSFLIKKAGGLKSTAFVEAAKLLRIKDASEKNVNEIVKNLEEHDTPGAFEEDKSRFYGTEDISIMNEYYRIIFDLKNAISTPGGYNDITIEGGDLIVIPKLDSTVKVKGEVRYPISIAFSEKMNTLKYYINSAGGYTDNADVKKVLITYPNGTHAQYSDRRGKTKIIPGSSIYIPKRRVKNKKK